MDLALLKYNKIVDSSDGCNRSAKIVQDDIVAMLSTIKRNKTLPPPKGPPTGNIADDTIIHKIKAPPFVRHFDSSTNKGGTPYKLGDTKD